MLHDVDLDDEGSTVLTHQSAIMETPWRQCFFVSPGPQTVKRHGWRPTQGDVLPFGRRGPFCQSLQWQLLDLAFGVEVMSISMDLEYPVDQRNVMPLAFFKFFMTCCQSRFMN